MPRRASRRHLSFNTLPMRPLARSVVMRRTPVTTIVLRNVSAGAHEVARLDEAPRAARGDRDDDERVRPCERARPDDLLAARARADFLRVDVDEALGEDALAL